MSKSVSHMGNAGDIISSLPAVRQYSKLTGQKINYYIFINRKGAYYQGATHPTLDDGGNMVMMNQKMTDFLVPLLKSQSYIGDAKVWEGEPIDVDLNKFREMQINTAVGQIQRWYFYVFPNLACDLSGEYIELPETDMDIAKGKIIVNRTERYHNELISYFFLKKYEKELIFAGTPKEHELFCKEWRLDIPYLQVNDFLEYAQAIKQSRFYLGNQSMGFQIAEGIKHPRILEVCQFAPNVIPCGENAFDFQVQVGVEYYVDYLYNLTK